LPFDSIRSIHEIGDAAEALGLALGAIGAVGAVEAHQLGVGLGIENGLDSHLEADAGRQVADDELAFIDGILARRQLHAVDHHRSQRQFVAIEHQRRILGRALAAMHQRALDDEGFAGVEFEGQVNPFENEIGRTVVCQMNDLAGGSFHVLSRSACARFPVFLVCAMVRGRGTGRVRRQDHSQTLKDR
jgi:hypothetical protein